MKKVDNTPNTKIVDSLRHSGYNNRSAVLDICDNSVDANASRVDIIITNGNGSKSSKIEDAFNITIADNGCGMDSVTLTEALKLGSETPHQAGDLGTFGMGLVTAGLSIAKRITVYTKVEEGKLIKGVLDIERIRRNNEWFCFVGATNKADEIEFFDSFVRGVSGTLVVLDKCDRVTYSQIDGYRNGLVSEVSKKYYQMLDSVKVYVNATRVKPRSPLEPQIEANRTCVDIPVEGKVGRKIVRGEVQVQTVILPDKYHDKKDPDKELNYNASLVSHGVYYAREGRIIKHRATFGEFGNQAHNSLLRLRVVVNFDSSLDALFGVTFLKDDVNIHQSVKDTIREHVKLRISEMGRIYKKTKVKLSQGAMKEGHEEAQRLVAKVSRYMKWPTKNKYPKGTTRSPSNSSGNGSTGVSQRKVSVPSMNRSFLCEYAHLGDHAPLWHFDAQGGEIITTWNLDHPFADIYCTNGNDEQASGKAVSEVMELVAFGLARATLCGANDDYDIDDVTLRQSGEFFVDELSRLLKFVSQVKEC